VAKGGHPLEIPEGRWKYETTRAVERDCAFSQRERWEEKKEGREPEADGGKVKVEVRGGGGRPP